MLLIFASFIGAGIALGSYKLFIEEEHSSDLEFFKKEDFEVVQDSPQAKTTFVSRDFKTVETPDFVETAEKTVNAVVHVKNVEVVDAPRNLSEYLSGVRPGKHVRGMGSGVIVTPDGYIVTNSHVIENATELEVTLSDNKTYTAEVIGDDPQEDIALLKIEADELNYLPFGDSNNTEVGEWVLAVGNPLNLTSTVTAGIISAKGRNLDENDTRMQSYIQTDAVINPGNSGGALVNTNGELIGINAAITSQTGSYIGYGFAIPSNNARKIVEDIMEYGDVKHAILGVAGQTIDPKKAEELGLSISQGVRVQYTAEGAKESGLKKDDYIVDIDGVRIRKMSDLTAYVGTKRPGDEVKVKYIRAGKEKKTKVRLAEYEIYDLQFNKIELEITNADKEYLAHFNASNGVRITQTTSRYLQIPQDHYIIVGIDGQEVNSVKEVKKIMKKKSDNEKTRVTFQNRNGQQETLVF